MNEEKEKLTIAMLLSRAWHIALLIASFYVTSQPDLVFLAPLIQSLAQGSNPPK